MINKFNLIVFVQLSFIFCLSNQICSVTESKHTAYRHTVDIIQNCCGYSISKSDTR